MRRKPAHHRYATTGVTVGWLFADLLLALGMLFLISSTVGAPFHASSPTPNPTHTPTPTRSTRILEHNYCQIVLTASDPTAIGTDQGSTNKQLEPQLLKMAFLHGRKVGIAIAYGGIGENGDEAQGQQVASMVYNTLKDLGKRSSIFSGTSYFDPLFTHGYADNQVVIDVYLVVRSSIQKDTCDSNHNPPH
jgi:hypothetical protein